MLLVGVVAVLVPVGLGFAAAHMPGDRGRVVLAALVGLWPDAAGNIDPEPWFGVVVGISAFALFGIPTALGAFVSVMLKNTERRIQMSVREYLADRDAFIESEVYRELRLNLKNAVSAEKCEQMARNAVRRAATAWSEMQDERFADALDRIEMPSRDLELENP